MHTNCNLHTYTSLVCVAGPTELTVVKFWQMVWEYQVNTIVMLTRCVEDNKVAILYTYEVVTYRIPYYYRSLSQLWREQCIIENQCIYTIGKV